MREDPSPMTLALWVGLLVLVGVVLIVMFSDPPPGGARAGNGVAVLEVRFEVPATDPTAAEFPCVDGGTLFLGDSHRFDLVELMPTTDDIGKPALAFEVTAAHSLRFRNLTGAHVNDRMAIMALGQVVTAPTIMMELPAQGVLSLWRSWSPAVLEKHLRRVR